MGFGIGAFPAGSTPAGYDPVIPAGAPRRVVPPPALKFDGATRDFPLDENGFYQASHPVDQQAALALCVSRGAIASVSSIGNKLRTISRVSPAVAETLAKTYIREGLASLTSAKSIEVIQPIQIDLSVPGRLMFAVSYLNLELAYLTENKPRTLTAELAYA
jgi:hypothetical protein